MKTPLLFVLLFMYGSIYGQPRVKIYAYSQVTTPGNIPSPTGENTFPTPDRQPPNPVNYYIFAAYDSSATISFTGIWIKGRSYQVQTEKTSSPVLLTNNSIPDDPGIDIMVPATQLKVTSISPVGSPGNRRINKSWFRNMLKTSELIVSYFYKGKTYFIPVGKIKELAPAPGE